MDEENKIAVFDAYLSGNMSSVEKKRFEQRLASEPQFKKEFEEHKLLLEAFRRTGRAEALASISTIHENLGEIQPKDYSSQSSRAWRNFFRNLFVYSVLIGTAYAGYIILNKEMPSGKDETPVKKEVAEPNSSESKSGDYKTESTTKSQNVETQAEPPYWQELRVDTVYTRTIDTVYNVIQLEGTKEELEQKMKDIQEQFVSDSTIFEIESDDDDELRDNN